MQSAVRIVVDDFGTAYSSLSHLRRLPTYSLNIERSFTLRLGVEPEDTAIAAAMIDLAHALGWEVRAEGVKTANRLAQPDEPGCGMAPWVLPLATAEQRGVLAFLEEAAS